MTDTESSIISNYERIIQRFNEIKTLLNKPKPTSTGGFYKIKYTNLEGGSKFDKESARGTSLSEAESDALSEAGTNMDKDPYQEDLINEERARGKVISEERKKVYYRDLDKTYLDLSRQCIIDFSNIQNYKIDNFDKKIEFKRNEFNGKCFICDHSLNYFIYDANEITELIKLDPSQRTEEINLINFIHCHADCRNFLEVNRDDDKQEFIDGFDNQLKGHLEDKNKEYSLIGGGVTPHARKRARQDEIDLDSNEKQVSQVGNFCLEIFKLYKPDNTNPLFPLFKDPRIMPVPPGEHINWEGNTLHSNMVLFFSEFYPGDKLCYLNKFTFEHYKDSIIETSNQSKLRREKQCMARCFRDDNVWNSDDKNIWQIVNGEGEYKEKRYKENMGFTTEPITRDCLKTKSKSLKKKKLNEGYTDALNFDLNKTEYNPKYIFAIEHVYPKTNLKQNKFYQNELDEDGKIKEIDIKPISERGDPLHFFPVNLSKYLNIDILKIDHFMLFYSIEKIQKNLQENVKYKDVYHKIKAVNFIISNYKWACVLCNSLKSDYLV